MLEKIQIKMYIKKGRSTKLFERVIPITKTRSKEKRISHQP